MGQYRYIVGWLVSNLPTFNLHSESVALNRYVKCWLRQYPRNILEVKTSNEAMNWLDLLDKKDGSHAFIFDKVRESIYLWKTL